MEVLAVLVVGVLVLLGLTGLVLFTVAPFVVGQVLAERRGFSTARWGLVSLVLVVAGGGTAGLLWFDVAKPLVVVGLGLMWGGPGLVALLEPSSAGPRGLGGYRGKHA